MLDVPCTLDELFLQTLAAADQVVFVAEPNPASLRSLHLVLEMLNQAGEGRGDYPVYVVLNRYDSRNSDVEPRRIQELLRVRRLYTVGNDYTAIRAALNGGQTLRAQAPRSKALADIDRLARILYGGDEIDGGGWKLFNPLARMFGMGS